MQKSFLILVILCLGLNSWAQEANKVHELGLYTENLDDFGLRYKFGDENLLYRITSTVLDFNKITYEDSPYDSELTSFGMSFAVGLEKHKSLDERLAFYYGPELAFEFNHQKTEDDSNDLPTKQSVFGFQLGAILGVRYAFTEQLSLSAEFVPGLGYARSDDGSDIDKAWSFSFESNQLGLTLAYRF